MRRLLLFFMAMIAGSALSFADSDIYELVTSTNSLAAGDEVLIVYVSTTYGSTTYYAMGATSGNYRSGVSVTVSSNTIELQSTNTSVYRFTLGTSSSYWTVYSPSDAGYLGYSSSYLITTTSVSSSNYVTLNISSSGATSFKLGTGSRYLNYSSSRFTIATLSNTNIRIFKKRIVPDAPTFSPAAGEYNEAQSVTLSTATDGATIYYTTDGSTPTTSSKKYTNAIAVGEGTTTINAIAVLNGVSSEVATATYTVTIERETYYLVTNAAALAEGDQIILVYGANNKAMADQLSEGNRATTKFSFTGDSIVMLKKSNDVTRFILGGSASARTFQAINNTEGYLYNSGSEGYLNTQSTAGDYAKASVKIASDGNATITFASEGSNRLLAYYLDPDAGPGGDDPTPPIVGAKAFGAPVAGSEVVECFTFIDAIDEEAGYHYVQIYTTNPREVTTTDINRDGEWDIADVTALVNIILGKDNNEPYQYDHQAADVDGNGSITIADAIELVNTILGK